MLSSSTPVEAATRILGGRLTVGPVTMKIVEVEAYGGDVDGPWPDPAAHSFRGRTARNAVMFGPAGFLYVYLSYGIHFCANVVCGPDGTGAAVLIRAGEVIDGLPVARERRPTARRDADLARGPGNVGSALALSLSHNGSDVFSSRSPIALSLGKERTVSSGPRIGVSVASERPWRFWIRDSEAVSAYRRSPRAPLSGAGW
ncbi:DNA-3-methyladenine glycosylase [Actinomycetes bacterium M1A6_2h]